MTQAILVALGGFAGAVCRYIINRAIDEQKIPVATLTVNLSGSFFLGLILGLNQLGNFYFFAGVGFLGAFTTFSTLNLEVIKMISKKRFSASALYMILTYLGGLGIALLGLIVGRLFI